MSKRKSIVSSFGEYRNRPKSQQSVGDIETTSTTGKTKRVAAGIVGTTKRTLTEIREERDELLKQAESSQTVVKIDTKLIDPSPFRDRLPDDTSDNFQKFKETIDQQGQQIPITVRPNPKDKDRFETVYGHRRVKALRELNLPALAIIKNYSDRELVIAQGLENGERQDLSWIERALFAEEMSLQGIKPKDIKAALAIDDAEMSKLRSVTNKIPRTLIEAIGRAPNVGRPRWLQLASLMSDKGSVALAKKTLSADKVDQLRSDDRFVTVMTALAKGTKTAEKNIQREKIKLGQLGSMSVSPGKITINLGKRHTEPFAAFLEGEMSSLIEKYQGETKRK